MSFILRRISTTKTGKQIVRDQPLPGDAITLGREPARVDSHRRYLAEHRFQTPLFDTPGLVRDLETQLEALVAGTLSEA